MHIDGFLPVFRTRKNTGRKKQTEKMSDALFIFPKDTILFGVPLGIANLAACLREFGAEVKIIDLRYEPETKLTTEVNSEEYKLIGIYSSSEIANVACR